MDLYPASAKLPDFLRDPVKSNSTSVDCTPFTEAMGTTGKLGYWDWLEEKIEQPDGTMVNKPSFENFALAMLGGGRVEGPALYYGTWRIYTLSCVLITFLSQTTPGLLLVKPRWSTSEGVLVRFRFIL